MAKIEKGCPLPSHTKLSYDECYAKIVLEKFFPDRYSELQLRDKPDLQDLSHSVGVEVTTIIPKSEQEAISIFIKLPYVDEEEKNKLIAHLEKMVINIQGLDLLIHREVLGGADLNLRISNVLFVRTSPKL